MRPKRAEIVFFETRVAEICKIIINFAAQKPPLNPPEREETVTLGYLKPFKKVSRHFPNFDNSGGGHTHDLLTKHPSSPHSGGTRRVSTL